VEVRRPDVARFVAAQRAAGFGVVVFDASTDDDIDRALDVALERRPVLLVGSTGLAGALRRAAGGDRPAAAPAPHRPGGVLIVAGSMHPATEAAIERVRARGMATLTRLDDAPAAATPLTRNGAVVLTARGVPANGAQVARRLGDAAAEIVGQVGGALAALVLIGGETAYHAVRALGISRLLPIGRLQPLIVASTAADGVLTGLTIVTKGGSSAGEDALADVLAWLRPADGAGAVEERHDAR
jgi:uncharacterized protein YgbK (DUF1537 family)